MDSASLAIQIIPDLTIDQKYSAIIDEALKRVTSFTDNALTGDRLTELFVLEKTKIDERTAKKILRLDGGLLVGFQFEPRPDALENNFRVFVRKPIGEKKKKVKFYLTPTVQEIILQLISLEDRRTVAIFSMLNSSLDIGYRVLTTLYGNQLKRLMGKAAPFITETMSTKLEKLQVSRASDDDLWQDEAGQTAMVSGTPEGNRPGSQDNILQVMADDGVFNEINQYVENITSRTERIKEKRHKLEENPDAPRSEIYEQMVREDLDQLENCYARIHIYLRAFYKNQTKRNGTRNGILRQFFAGEIERITGETSLLEDLLSLNEEEYFRNIDRHKEL